MIKIVATLFVLLASLLANKYFVSSAMLQNGAYQAPRDAAARVQLLSRSTRAAGQHHDDHHQHHKFNMHNHLSRKVFERACAASKDTIDEIIACLTSNQALIKAVKEDTAKSCYKESFGQDFNPNDVFKHKELICNNRDKFESMTTCIYSKTSEAMDAKEHEKMIEAMVDVGLCIVNALDG